MKWIPGFEGKYYANANGQVFKKGKHKDRLLKGHKHHNLWVVKLTIDGKSKDYNYGRLIFETFKGPIPNGYVIYRKNKLVSDNRLMNLKITTISNRGKSTGPRSRSKPVELLDDNGQIINSWASARKAAKELFCSYQTITDICNRKVKKKLLNVRWEKLV